MDKFPWKLSCLAGQLLRGAKPGDQGAWIEVVQRVSEVGLEGLEFPAPLPARTYAAMAYGAMKETRHGNDYTKQIVVAGFMNPDVITAAERVGLGKLTRRR